MEKLPNANGAVIELTKLRDYCLSSEHPRGRHKARVFREALGLTVTDVEWLQQQFMEAIQNHSAEKQATDRFGSRWRIDIPLTRQDRSAVVRTIWMINTGENFPRLITCWVI
jgi:hypothetical protein